MIRYFYAQDGYLKAKDSLAVASGMPLVWVDLLNPDDAAIRKIDAEFDLDLPTQEEMRELEISSRLYEDAGSQYMTMTYLSNALGDRPEITQITFVLRGDVLFTMRYREMRIISHFIEKAESKGLRGIKSGRDLFLFIIENFIDLCSDVLEKNHADLEVLSIETFDPGHKRKDYKKSLKKLAAIGDLNSKARETLASLNRTLAFWGGVCESQTALKDVSIRVKSMTVDVVGLLDHAGFVAQKVTFLLDATLGLVDLEQNAIIKIFSVAAVIFLPPTLVASIYGMNFKYIPETEWVYGYPMALLMMVLSALVPYLYFKFKNWL